MFLLNVHSANWAEKNIGFFGLFVSFRWRSWSPIRKLRERTKRWVTVRRWSLSSCSTRPPWKVGAGRWTTFIICTVNVFSASFSRDFDDTRRWWMLLCAAEMKRTQQTDLQNLERTLQETETTLSVRRSFKLPQWGKLHWAAIEGSREDWMQGRNEEYTHLTIFALPY